ncbi:cell surface protein [Brachyspira sp.]|uniref:cell surface protein n=1 Tax=Brachyspira sp. TaxID=1977261 RepID=UPI003D7EC409
MKKILLTTVALLSMASASVFGMYGVDTDWIFFLTHGNQFRARLDQLGFTLGNDTIKGTFGFDNNTGYGGAYGAMLSYNSTANVSGDDYNWVPSISMGIGYTSSVIGIGVGYNATIGTERYKAKPDSKSGNEVTHTPVLVLNALDNAFRMAIPIQVFVKNTENGGVKQKEQAVSVDSQFRYYTGLEMLPQVRLYLRYGNYSYDNGNNDKGKYGESFGFDFRLYFGSMVEEVALQPIVRLVYNGALGKQHNNRRVEAVKAMNGTYSTNPTGVWEQSAWDVKLLTALGLTANSDIVSLYFEPSLGLDITQGGSASQKVKETYRLAYDVYAEIYITPIKNLEWYFEASIGNIATQTAALAFAGTTGITWYLPAL